MSQSENDHKQGAQALDKRTHIKWDIEELHSRPAGKMMIGRVNCIGLFVVEKVKDEQGADEYVLKNWFLSPQAVTKSTFDEIKEIAERRLSNFMALAGFCHDVEGAQ